MKKIILIIAIAGALAFETTGCEIETSAEGSEGSKRKLNETTVDDWANKVEYFTDPDTGVQYLIFKLDDEYIIQPRYNPDGTIKTID